MQVAYEDRLKGKMPEDICISFIQKYSEEQKRLETEIAELEGKLTETENTIQSADEFIRNTFFIWNYLRILFLPFGRVETAQREFRCCPFFLLFRKSTRSRKIIAFE